MNWELIRIGIDVLSVLMFILILIILYIAYNSYKKMMKPLNMVRRMFKGKKNKEEEIIIEDKRGEKYLR